MPDTDLDIRVLVTTENSPGSRTFQVRAHVVYIGTYASDAGQVRHFSESDFHYGVAAGLDFYANLTVTGQADTDRPGDIYGIDVCYEQPYRLKLRDVEAMTKTLRKVEKGLARLEAVDGAPYDFVDYVNRVAKVLKIKKSLGYRTDGGEYRWVSVDQVRFHVNHALSESRKANGVEVAAR